MSRLHNKNHILTVTLMTVLVAIILTWMAQARLSAFHQHHLDISRESANGIVQQVAFYVAEKKRMVAIFAMEHLALIRKLAKNPEDDQAHDTLGRLLTQHFPDRFAFSVANQTGEPLFEDFDGLVSSLCLQDLKQFASSQADYRPFIHPNADGYHFDVMVHYGENEMEGIFFVSFLADILGNIIDSIQSPDHRLMLIYPNRSQLIEVIASGARNHIDRNDYRLTEKEMSQITMRKPINGTQWHVIDFHNDKLHNQFRNKLIVESTILFALFFTIATFMAWRLRREESQRNIAEQQKAALTSLITHEFRSPAATISSAMEMLIETEAANLPADSIRLVEIAQRSSTGLLLLVNDFLDIQQADSGNLRLTLNTAPLQQIVKLAIEDNEAYAKKFNVNYHLAEPCTEALVSCDKNRIKQVLTNLLTNAAKYGGENDEVIISVTNEGPNLRVNVTDHGAGISENFQAKVFEKFSKGKHAKKQEQIKSSGLGLSISRAIIELHKGSIGFDTKVNQGTTFWFQLPIVYPSAQAE